MNDHAQALIEIGNCWGAPLDQVSTVARKIPRSYFHDLSSSRFEVFDFLGAISFEEAFSYIKGLVQCEEMRISPFPGSTSLVIWAFNATQRRRPFHEWAQIADWIVENHQNPYSPFNFRRTREQWEAAKREFVDPVSIAQRASDLEGAHQAQKRQTAIEHQLREHIQGLKTGRAPESPELRQRMIEKLEKEAGWPEER